MTSSVAQEIGQQLQQARQVRGLSLHDVADRLKLSLRQLEAIETGDYSRLPGATFVRGFVRNYARFLELDSTPLMAQLDQLYPPQPVARAEPVASAPQPAANPARFAWLLLPLALLGGYQWWQSRPAEPVDGALAPMLHQTASADVASAPLSQAASAPSVAVASQPLPAAVSVVPAVASAPSAVPAAKPLAVPASAPLAAGSKQLRLVASGESWVSVVDATGKRLVFGTLAAGTTREVAGVPPFKLKIGNAPAMALSYEGAAVDLKDKTRGTTAKLELN